MTIPDLSGFDFRQYIDGQWCDANNGNTWDLINPGTEETILKVPYGDDTDCRQAIESAAKSFPEWSQKTPYERAAVLMGAAQKIRENIESIFPINSAESGKTIGDAKGDLLAAAALFEWFAEEGKRAYGRTIPSRTPGKRLTVMRQPIGVVGIITAWNFPGYNQARALGAALAAGCTVVTRPSEFTPLTCMILTQYLVDSGMPAGVINLINGEADKMGQEMLNNDKLRLISFTGSTRVGKILMEGASRTMTRLSLELGGNAPVLIFDDADMKMLHESAAVAKYRNVGQVCLAPQRYLVHSKVHDQFLESVVPQVKKFKVGVGMQEGTEIGPLINAKQRDHVESLVKKSLSEKVKIETGGNRPGDLDKGYFFEPTVLSNVQQNSVFTGNEVFGPVMPVMKFDELDEVIERANATPWGLGAYVFTRDITKATIVSEQLEFGLVGVNTWGVSSVEGPFPGWKQSGIGMESGSEGLNEYLETKLVSLGL